jgi:AcrR family transcriptional regulator
MPETAAFKNKQTVTTVKNTEETILEAARKVFVQKGFAAARMCEIAKTANINQALLHYYFRKKDKLFSIIFEQESRKFYADFLSILKSERPFFEKIRLLVAKDIQKITSAPFLPMFILNEMHSNPERLDQFLGSNHRHAEIFNVFSEVVLKEQAEGRIRQVCPRQLFLSILGLTTFPFLAQPMIKHVLDIDDTDFNQMISERVEYASDMLIRSLKLD